jgi:predicted AlkP superfamily phosphohydrolase/phosphomutase
MKRSTRPLLACALAASLALPLLLSVSCGTESRASTARKVLVIGMDGLDPELLMENIEAGRMPNFKAFIEKGSFSPLGTSIPPQSPVAWSNFITGMDPGSHGLFDFIHRDPETLLPYLSTTRTEDPSKVVSLGKWRLPLESGKIDLLRQGTAFWEVLEKHRVPCTIFRIPSNFPPVGEKSRTLAGMGTPDMRGTYGIFTFYTDDPASYPGDVNGGDVIPIEVIDGVGRSTLAGPDNTFIEGSPRSEIPFVVYADPDHGAARIDAGNQTTVLNEGEWSDWVRVSFPLLGKLKSVSGIFRMYLQSTDPLGLYVTPLNIDPAHPALPLSTPESFAPHVCELEGPFYTQGIPEDTKALESGIFSDDDFLEQANLVLEERLQHFRLMLDEWEEGFLFFYFSSSDQVTHMVWRCFDETHPGYDPYAPAAHRHVVEHVYARLDSALGAALEVAGPDTPVIVMSDHGFAPFHRAINLNTWLYEMGYLALVDPDDRETDILRNVDWENTLAYAFGLNGLYVNRAGRERYGVVQSGEEYDQLLDELEAQLLEIQDPETGEHVISRVYRARDVYHGPYVDDAPDIQVGYARGYRSSNESALGGFPEELIVDNMKKWSGDHCMATEEVPGIIATNLDLTVDDPDLKDLAPSILALYGVEALPDMVGRNIFGGRGDMARGDD